MANEQTSVVEYEIPTGCTCKHEIADRSVVRHRDLGCPEHGDEEAAVVERAVAAALEVANTVKGMEHLTEPTIRRLLRAALPIARAHGFMTTTTTEPEPAPAGSTTEPTPTDTTTHPTA